MLRIGLTEPYVRLGTTLNGPERTAENRELEARSTAPRFSAYAHLIQEMLNGDPMLFIRGDEAEEAWRIIDPVVQAWSAGEVPMQEYAAGTRAPRPRVTAAARFPSRPPAGRSSSTSTARPPSSPRSARRSACCDSVAVMCSTA